MISKLPQGYYIITKGKAKKGDIYYCHFSSAWVPVNKETYIRIGDSVDSVDIREFAKVPVARPSKLRKRANAMLRKELSTL